MSKNGLDIRVKAKNIYSTNKIFLRLILINKYKKISKGIYGLDGLKDEFSQKDIIKEIENLIERLKDICNSRECSIFFRDIFEEWDDKLYISIFIDEKKKYVNFNFYKSKYLPPYYFSFSWIETKKIDLEKILRFVLLKE